MFNFVLFDLVFPVGATLPNRKITFVLVSSYFGANIDAVLLNDIYITQIFDSLFIFLKLYIWFPCYMEPVVMTHGALA